MGSDDSLESLASDLDAGLTRSRDLAELCLDRISNPAGEGARAFLAVDGERVRAIADAADTMRRNGYVMSRFQGIPISIKDSFDIAGELTRAGALTPQTDEPVVSDAPAVASLRRQGFVFVGRTNMTEFAYSGLGINPHFGTPANPYQREQRRIPGGSSSGAAVSVTDGMAFAGIGTDTGGSCRIPAALCGLAGYKPTASSISLDGVVPLSTTLDSIGALARTVSCLYGLHSVMAGGIVRAPLAARHTDGLRLAIPSTRVLDDLDADVASDFKRAVAALERAGFTIKEMPFALFDEIVSLNARGGFTAPEAYAWHEKRIGERGSEYDRRVRTRIEAGADVSAADYVRLVAARSGIVKRFESAMAAIDALIFPTTPIIAPHIAALENDDDLFVKTNLLMLRNSSFINFVDGCAVSVPMHKHGTAPTGLSLAAPGNHDEKLLNIAAAVEKIVSPAS